MTVDFAEFIDSVLDILPSGLRIVNPLLLFS